ncbi:DUF6191 domain-containing protein [Amycolatopsis sp. CA-230715]|uniref:DUF6191 domain-containing protein n=1 Tax=Amycolatopsis sp. CA-230715 TaxID=2745196 RepID=UPI001C035D70|nr:DUF6191 domain-containing protein [Amycolatopsis sp. CA-230715]QWF84613.1 hypothetical protein HUW46_08064 [Amycolatopsis sp. CA-230715]
MDTAVVWGLSLPGLFLLLFFGVAAERVVRWVLARRRGERRPRGMGHGKRMATARGTEEIFSFFYGTKRHELEHRDVELVLRQEEDDGAPPGKRIDLESGVAKLDLPRRRLD